jgi:hypothetical protein
MENKIQLNAELILLEEDKENAFASVSLNPFYQWAKIVVTDDQPNANKQRIPEEEFENLIRTGIFSPIKMSEGTISPGHADAVGKPIGILAQLVKEGNKIISLAALWKKERENDIAMLKDMYLKGTPPQVSWEISYSEEKEEEGGIKALIGTVLNGLAIVTNPAYAGRTSFVAMASEGQEDKNSSMNEELEKLNLKIAELEKTLADAKAELEKQKTDAEVLNRELEELRVYKENIEKEKAEAEKFDNIKKKFADAGIAKDETFFNEKKAELLSLTEEALDFMIQELIAAFNTSAEDRKIILPKFVNTSSSAKPTPAELATALRGLKR